jgi:hypothetical protein
MTDGQQGKQAGPGTIGDAPTAFGDALLAAAKTLGAQQAGDPKVMAAVQLGWMVGSLVTKGAQTPLPAGFPIDAGTVYRAKAVELPGLLARVKVDVTPGPGQVTAVLAAGEPPTAELADWEPHLVAALLAADVRLAKAFGAGRQINLIAYQDAYGDPPVDLKSAAVTGLIDALDDLTTALPPHVGRAVAYSVRAWQTAASAPAASVRQAQCELWRIVLTGEKRATELLEPENYVDAAEALAVKLRAAAIKVVRQYRIAIGVVVAILILAIALLLFTHGVTKALAGVSGILVALGLTWKGVGTIGGRLAAQLEAPLWGAELDGAITEAITLGVPSPLALADPRPATDGDYAQRAQRRPGIDPAQTG